MKVLDLFSGIGGFSLGLERAGMETVAFCEFDKKCQLVLKKHWPDVPIYDDVRELTYGRLKEDGIVVPLSTGDGLYTQEQGSVPQNKRQAKTGKDAVQVGRHSTPDGRTGEEDGRQFEGPTIDLICGGFPCQPFSQAGKRKGEEDDRHLWPEYFRIIQEIRPRWVIGENVSGLISMGLDDVLSDLESENYSCQTLVIPACAINAPHRRDRVWIVGNSERERGQSRVLHKGDIIPTQARGKADTSRSTGERSKALAHSRLFRQAEHEKQTTGFEQRSEETDVEDTRRTLRQRAIKQGTDAKEIGQGDADQHQRSGSTPELNVAHTKGGNRDESPETQEIFGNGSGPGRFDSWWAVEPNVGRVAHGVPNRVDRLKQLGNAVVPQVVEQIGRAIMKIERE